MEFVYIVLSVILFVAILPLGFLAGASFMEDKKEERRPALGVLFAILAIGSSYGAVSAGNEASSLGEASDVKEAAELVVEQQEKTPDSFETNLITLQINSSKLEELTTSEGVLVGLEGEDYTGTITARSGDQEVIVDMENGEVVNTDCSGIRDEYCPFE